MSSKLAVVLVYILLLLSGCSSISGPEKKQTVWGEKKVFREHFPGAYNGEEWKESKEDLKIQLDVYRKTLRNGLTVLIVENKHLPVFSLHLFYKIGSRYEMPGITGATHFLEHLMFKGAKKYGPGEFDTTIERSGGSSNAYTTMDITAYHEVLPSIHLEKILDMEADRMQNLLLEPLAFEKERLVILEERKMRYENSPGGQLYQAVLENMFVNTPYALPTIGTVKDIEGVSREQIQKHFQTFYAPNNAVLVIVGGVDRAQTLELVDKYFGEIPESRDVDDAKEKRDEDKLFEWNAAWGEKVKIKGASVNPMFMLVYKGDKLGTHRAYVMDLLASILGDGASSFLVGHFVSGKSPKASSISAYNYNLKKSGIFYISGELLPHVNVAHFEEELREKLVQSCYEAIDERSVQKTKNQYLVDYFKSLQTNSGVASFIGIRQTYFDDYEIYKKELDTYNAITAAEIKDLCRELFAGKENMFFSIWDKNN